MKYHRYRCGGSPFGWPYRYAWGAAWSGAPASQPEQPEEEGWTEEAGGRKTWYAHRGHSRRSSRSASFGVRRPLRYLSYQLDLEESQRRKVAAVLDRVKVEREQLALDEKKMAGDLADLIEQPELNMSSLEDTLTARVRSTEQLQKTIAHGLSEIVAALDADQREEFAYLLRTGAFSV